MKDVVAQPIWTPRLVLRPLIAAYADEMAVVLADPGLHEFIGGEPVSPAQLRARYERLAAGSPDPEVAWLNWVVERRADQTLAGTVQATLSRDALTDDPVAEVAWVVGPAWQGRGYATEAAVALVDWLGALPVRLVVAHIHPAHAASAAVARAADLHPTDRTHDGETRWERAVG